MGVRDGVIEAEIGIILRRLSCTVATAESCTGGLIADRITNVSGASDYFMAGAVTYSNKAKEECLGVPKGLIAMHGAVSAEVAGAMAEGIRRRMGVDFGLAVTGIAGPAGGSAAKPVGTVYIAVSGAKEVVVRHFSFAGERINIKAQTSEEALRMLLTYIEKKPA